MEEQDHDEENANGLRINSPEIVEINEEEDEEDSKIIRRNCRGIKDVYVSVGRNDFHVVKWAIDHLVSPGTQLFLVHVFPPIEYISTTVGILSSSQLSNNQMQVYRNEEQNRRKHLLEKYIRLCNDAKVPVDTMLIESNTTTTSILQLIRVINITHLVMGTKRSSIMRRLMKGRGKGEYVKKEAPNFCDVILVQKNGERKSNKEEVTQRTEIFDTIIASKGKCEDTKHIQKSLSKLMCFSDKFNI